MVLKDYMGLNLLGRGQTGSGRLSDYSEWCVQSDVGVDCSNYYVAAGCTIVKFVCTIKCAHMSSPCS